MDLSPSSGKISKGFNFNVLCLDSKDVNLLERTTDQRKTNIKHIS